MMASLSNTMSTRSGYPQSSAASGQELSLADVRFRTFRGISARRNRRFAICCIAMPEYKYVPQNGHNLYRHLAAVPNSELFHERHSAPLAHPADLLSEKLAEVVDLYVRIANDIKEGEVSAQRADLTKALVLSVNEFYDQLFLIIKCLTPPGPSGPSAGQRQTDVLSQLRESNGPVLRKFYVPTKGEHTLIRNIANVLKHQPSSIVLLQLVNHRGVAVQGFIVQVVIGPDDLRGPSRAIHPMYKVKVNTGISFNHFLLNVLGRVFSYMERLDAALFTATSPEVDRRLPDLDRLIDAAQAIESEFFPDEYKKPYAQLTTRRETKVMTFPARYRLARNENPDRIHSISGPGFVNQRTWRSHHVLPYLQLTRPDSDWL